MESEKWYSAEWVKNKIDIFKNIPERKTDLYKLILDGLAKDVSNAFKLERDAAYKRGMTYQLDCERRVDGGQSRTDIVQAERERLAKGSIGAEKDGKAHCMMHGPEVQKACGTCDA